MSSNTIPNASRFALQPDDVDYLIYHSPCSDGTAAGWVAWKYLSTKFPERLVTYFPTSITMAPPLDLSGKNVLICDFSYKKPVLAQLLRQVNKLLILDHHKSAEKDLIDLPDENKHFDMSVSGAMLAWRYFFPDQPVPKMVEYVSNRDTWKNDLPMIEEFAAWFDNLPFKFETYDLYSDDYRFESMVATKGVAYVELNQHYIKRAVEHVAIKFTQIRNKYYLVGYVNATQLKSEIGAEIMKMYPLLDFSAVYHIGDYDNNTHFSLRSTDKHADVSEVATILGGGGHRNASGVQLPYVTSVLPGKVFEIPKLYDRLENLTYSCVSLNNTPWLITRLVSPVHARELSKYLLQIKVANTQIAQTILKNNHSYDLAVIFKFQPEELCQTIGFVTFADHVSETEKQKLTARLKGWDATTSTVAYSDIHPTLIIE